MVCCVSKWKVWYQLGATVVSVSERPKNSNQWLALHDPHFWIVIRGVPPATITELRWARFQ
jgi:hypothetical protein